MRVWTGKILYFGSKTKNWVEYEHSVLKAWALTCICDLDMIFLKIHSLIEGQVVEIKRTLEYSRMKEKYNASSNRVPKEIMGDISHLAMNIIHREIKSV